MQVNDNQLCKCMLRKKREHFLPLNWGVPRKMIENKINRMLKLHISNNWLYQYLANYTKRKMLELAKKQEKHTI